MLAHAVARILQKLLPSSVTGVAPAFCKVVTECLCLRSRSSTSLIFNCAVYSIHCILMQVTCIKRKQVLILGNPHKKVGALEFSA